MTKQHFLFNLNSKPILVEGYLNQKKSIRQLAEEIGTSFGTVRRALMYHGIVLRDKEEAQKAALDNGKATHPTEGCKRSVETRVKISESMKKYWRLHGNS